ncbi:two-component sensor histidine kinase/response regulator hybrid protein [Nitratireductor indicus C115]|uniref:histidine kinase n=1 Tax=Nitratireductor indicus C115 TaxID=1231190 RepID=K2N8N3_9HYPH|nr:HAMP domain-containing sensor histidine kinase [Nitratireductor indicus]EKF43858.1 two-component sensor histidine kinase/response regulator hybrid protein [Nitratireductor indicus C115]SFQ15396.1 HAMP domain-containing protein [Nitratireductor indicus]
MSDGPVHASGRGQGRSVRFRLLAIALLPTLVILPLLLGMAVYRWNAKFDAALTSKVNGDLTIAHQYFARILENTGEQLVALGQSARFRDVVGQPQVLSAVLEENRARLELDFLYLVTAEGTLQAAAPAPAGNPRQDWPIVVHALEGEASTGVDIFSGTDLEAISPDIAGRAELELVPTTNAVPTDRNTETRGMVVHSASPVQLADGRSAALVGGILLNRNLVFIDTINDLVYREASLPEGSQGTATLFLEDVRISTNVRLFEGRRALGTRVSAAVRSAVLGEGRVWLDSAFVVNDWYISAYEPISDSTGQRVGMLYVGFLEAPFTQAKYTTLLTIAAAFLAITALSVPIFLRWARSIFQPLERMAGTISQVEGGDLGARTGILGVDDEIGRVAQHLDHLLELLQERDRQLRAWNEDLNTRVEERTRELKLANRQLEATTKQLIMSEKLAAIGEITAGVAHEINNPIAVMQGNLEVVRQVMGERADDAKTEFRLLDEQIHRISQIVTKLLQFAKPEEYAGFVERHAPAQVISDTLPLVQHLLNKTGIAVERDDRAERLVLMNRTELQQVLVNLIVNAVHAMPDGGTLTLKTSDSDRDERAGLLLEVADTGVGMSPDLLAKVFDPFFTTKRREGTGLGLSISQTLISRQGGKISAVSEPGKGTVFSVWLPEAS